MAHDSVAHDSGPVLAADGRCCLAAASLDEVGVVRLNEPVDADAADLLARLRAGTYDKPFVIDDGVLRRLYLGLAYVQSEMTIAAPYTLNFAYTRKMVGFLLFHPRPKHVVIVGLGGGSLTRFCHRQLPRARITTVEIDPGVIAFGDLFTVPQDARHRLVAADAVNYFCAAAEGADTADVVLLDGCDGGGIAPAFCSEHFYGNIRRRLRARGMLVVNLVGSLASLRANLRVLEAVFAGRLIVQNVGEGGTKVAYAFKDAEYLPDWEALLRSARPLAQRHGLDFPSLARKLQRSGFGTGLPLRG